MRLKDYQLDVTTLKAIIGRQAALGDKIAIWMDDETISFAEIDARATRIANSLADRGVGKGDVVATYMYNSIDHVLAWFGCSKLGAIWAPINIALVQVDLEHTLRECAPVAVVIDAGLVGNYEAIRTGLARLELVEILRGGDGTLAHFTDFADLLQGSAVEPEVDIHWNDPAGIIFTGGSTGLPKGVLVSNSWYMAGLYRYQEFFQTTPNDVHMGVGQLYHTIGSAVEVLAPLYWGIPTVMTRWFNARDFWPMARRYGATISIMVGPVMLAMLAQPEAPDDADNPLRLVATATSGVPWEKVLAFRARYGVDTLETYGQTETGPLGSINQRLSDRPHHSQGTGNGWVDVMIGDPHGVACDPGVIGEIQIRSRYPGTFMSGYYNRPDKFAEACRDLWFHTGDLGYLDDGGYLHFTGRMSHSIRRRGENIAATEVEQVVMLHPDVERCAVVGTHDNRSGDEEILAFVRLVPGRNVDPLDLIKYCHDKIAYFKVPRYVRFVDEFPVSASKGEIERHKLKDIGPAGAFDREAAGYKVRRQA